MVIQPRSWLEDILASRPQVRMLRVLTRAPSKYWTGRELAAAAGLPQSTANVALRRLDDLHLLDMRQAGASQLFRLRSDLELTRRLRRVFALESSTFPDLLSAVADAVPQDVSCYLFGSAARDEEGPQSDVDILVAAEDTDHAQAVADDVRAALRGRLPVRADVIALGREELRSRRFAGLLGQIAKDGRRLSGPDLGAWSA